jgi:hypothetical protein
MPRPEVGRLSIAGSQTVQGYFVDYCGTGWPLNSGTTFQQGVSATSPHGIASWDVAHALPEGFYSPWTHYAQSASPVIQFKADNYQGDCGGGQGGPSGTLVRVTDNHGTQVSLEEDFYLQLERWDGSDIHYGNLHGTRGTSACRGVTSAVASRPEAYWLVSAAMPCRILRKVARSAASSSTLSGSPTLV